MVINIPFTSNNNPVFLVSEGNNDKTNHVLFPKIIVTRIHCTIVQDNRHCSTFIVSQFVVQTLSPCSSSDSLPLAMVLVLEVGFVHSRRWTAPYHKAYYTPLVSPGYNLGGGGTEE